MGFVTRPHGLIAEALGSFLFAYLGGAFIASTGSIQSEAMECTRVFSICLAEGLLLYALVMLTMKASQGLGGYFNPMLTVSLCGLDIFIDKRDNISRLGLVAVTIGAQFAGSLFGALLLPQTFPGALLGLEKAGAAQIVYPVAAGLSGGMTVFSAFVLSAILSAFFVVTVLSVRSNEERNSSWMIVFSYAALRLVSLPLTFDTLNPARSFAHGVVAGGVYFEMAWVFCLAPFVGSVLGTCVFIILNRHTLREKDETNTMCW